MQTNTPFAFTQLVEPTPVKTDNTLPLTQEYPQYFPYTFNEHPLIKTLKDMQELIFLCQSFEARLVHKHKFQLSRIEAVLFENSNHIPDEIYYKLMNAVHNKDY